MAKQDVGAFDALLAKLNRIAGLDGPDRDVISRWPVTLQTIRAGETFVNEGAINGSCYALLAGMASRQKLLENGRRQIVSFHFAGDLVDLQHLFFTYADHSIQAITDIKVARLTCSVIKQTVTERPAVAKALWTDTLIDASIFREWVLNVGRRDARARIAHLLCEFGTRMASAGLGSLASFDFPITQEHIGDATGLTSIHVNRTLRSLRDEGLVEYGGKRLTILDEQRMCAVAGFDPIYLHGLA